MTATVAREKNRNIQMLSESIYIPNKLFFAEVETQIKQGKKVRIRVRGNSMLPFLHNGDEVLLQPTRPNDIHKGAIVVAFTDEIPVVLHRIAKIEGEKITLLGDGNTHQWEHTSPDRIIAKVTHCYRGEKSWQTASALYRLAGRLWLAMHPWRRNIILLAWRIKNILKRKK